MPPEPANIVPMPVPPAPRPCIARFCIDRYKEMTAFAASLLERGDGPGHDAAYACAEGFQEAATEFITELQRYAAKPQPTPGHECETQTETTAPL